MSPRVRDLVAAALLLANLTLCFLTYNVSNIVLLVTSVSLPISMYLIPVISFDFIDGTRWLRNIFAGVGVLLSISNLVLCALFFSTEWFQNLKQWIIYYLNDIQKDLLFYNEQRHSSQAARTWNLFHPHEQLFDRTEVKCAKSSLSKQSVRHQLLDWQVGRKRIVEEWPTACQEKRHLKAQCKWIQRLLHHPKQQPQCGQLPTAHPFAELSQPHSLIDQWGIDHERDGFRG